MDGESSKRDSDCDDDDSVHPTVAWFSSQECEFQQRETDSQVLPPANKRKHRSHDFPHAPAIMLDQDMHDMHGITGPFVE